VLRVIGAGRGGRGGGGLLCVYCEQTRREITDETLTETETGRMHAHTAHSRNSSQLGLTRTACAAFVLHQLRHSCATCDHNRRWRSRSLALLRLEPASQVPHPPQ